MCRQSGNASPIDYAGVSPVRLPAHEVALSHHWEVISSHPQIRGRISSSVVGEEPLPRPEEREPGDRKRSLKTPRGTETGNGATRRLFVANHSCSAEWTQSGMGVCHAL